MSKEPPTRKRRGTSKKPAMVRKDDGVTTILIRKRVLDEFIQQEKRSGRTLDLPKKAYVPIMAALLAGYTEREAVLFGQRYSEGKVMVKHLRSGCELAEDPSWDEPCYVVMGYV